MRRVPPALFLAAMAGAVGFILATAPFVALLAAFLVFLLVWLVALLRRFRLPR
jgi:hypothetical protein